MRVIIKAMFREILIELFEKEVTHISFKDAVTDASFLTIGIKPNHLPYSIWQLVEHIRVTQKDILEFSFSHNYKGLNWPNDFWPSEIAPETEEEWNNSIKEVISDRQKIIDMIKNPTIDLLKPLHDYPDKNLFREALLILDHTTYHIGEIVVLRRLLEDWKE